MRDLAKNIKSVLTSNTTTTTANAKLSQFLPKLASPRGTRNPFEIKIAMTIPSDEQIKLQVGHNVPMANKYYDLITIKDRIWI